jgi:putative restriction endonuclease
MNPMVQTSLEMLLHHTGFDLEASTQGSWLWGKSTGAKVEVYLKQESLNAPIVYALTDGAVLGELNLASMLAPDDAPRPGLFYGVVQSGSDAYEILKRAFQLSRALPATPLLDFLAKTAHLPQNTEAEVETVRRIGQDRFRQALRDYWNDQCAATGFDIPELLRASHMKPWRDSTNEERLSPYNGLLLAPHLDLLFDKGYISFEDTGSLLISKRIQPEQLAILGLNPASIRVERLVPQHLPFLAWHREHEFK